MNRLSHQLIKWYEQHARDLPWRHTHDPFRIWVSEIILQQTQVKQGYDYYLRFIEAFPDVKTLYKASSDTLMKQWQGLGYYSRARNMHKAAAQIVEEHNGQFPNTYDSLLKLAGIGPYTASAIASFAYNLPHPVLDGNVYRFLSRYFGIDMPINLSSSYTHYIKVAESIMDKKNAGIHNQAIMEFGALQCKVQSPNCNLCILNDTCEALHQQKVNTLPVKIKKIKIKKRFLHFFYLYNNQGFVIEKRSGKDIWNGLYQLPLIETKEDSTIDTLLPQNYTHLFTKPNTAPQLMFDMWHQLTHQKLHIRFYGYHLPSKPTLTTGQWCQKADTSYAFPKPITTFLAHTESTKKRLFI